MTAATNVLLGDLLNELPGLTYSAVWFRCQYRVPNLRMTAATNVLLGDLLNELPGLTYSAVWFRCQ